jgi:hypothetical protein
VRAPACFFRCHPRSLFRRTIVFLSHTPSSHPALPLTCPASISKMGGVEGFVITDSEGVILRQSKSFSDQLAHVYAAEVVKLARRARHVVRDLDPKVRRHNPPP